MVCPSCGVEVSVGQPFCNGCGSSLRGVTEPTQPVEVELAATQPIEVVDLPATQPIEVVDLPATQPIDVDLPETQPIDAIDLAPATHHVVTTEAFAPPATAAVSTMELPTNNAAVFDGLGDVAEFPPERERFRVRVIFIAAFLGAVAALMAAVGDVVDIRTSRPTDGITSGMFTLDDIAGNLGPSGVVAAGVMVIGALLACFGLRWGAGLAGGAGLSLVGWAALTIGLVEVPVGVAESITRTSPDTFTLTVTRDVGWWLVVSVGAIGLIVFLASLRSIRRGRQRYLNPLTAGTGAVCMLVLAAGPLVPVGDAIWRDNLRSPTAAIDLPTVFFAGRLTQVGLIAVVGVVGFLLVRSYGLGLVAGGLSVATWLWVTSLLELGSHPTGIAARNPGAVDTVPHAVTIVGMIVSLAVLVIAVIIAVVARLTSPHAASPGP